MKKIIIFLLILFLGMQSTQVHSLQKAKGALLVGLSFYCYKKLLPSLFSWVKHPGKQYSNQQEFKEFDDGSAQWIVHFTNDDKQHYTITISLLKRNAPGILEVYWKKICTTIINDFWSNGVSLENLPGFTVHTNIVNNKCIMNLYIDNERPIAEYISSKYYIADPAIKIESNKSGNTAYWRLLYNIHASGLGIHNISNWACIGVGIYGGIKLTGIV